LKHYTSSSFWRHFERLPEEIQQLARANHQILRDDPWHPSLHLKRVGRFWSVRVGAHYRALGDPTEDGILWGWIGPHEEYDHLIRRR
jgi:hypothetical protein